MLSGPAAAGNGGSSSDVRASELPAATGSTSLDTWQQIDNSRSTAAAWASDRELDELQELLDRYETARRPTAAEIFGTTPIPADELDEVARGDWYALAGQRRPPAELVELVDDDVARPPTADELVALRAELAERPELARLLTRAQREALAGQVDAPESSRLLRNDAAKIELAETIGRAAAGRWQLGELADGAWLQQRASAMTGCRSVRAFRDALCGVYLARPNSCRVRVCPDCERARAARLAERFAGLSVDMARPVFWTFTVPNVASGKLGAGVDWLLESFRRLRRRAVFTGGQCRDVDDCTGHESSRGGVYAIEITWNGSRADWHPHVHALVDIPFVRWSEMRAAWRAVTCDAIRYVEQGGGRVKRCRHRVDANGQPAGGCRGASVVWVEAVKGAPGSPERARAIRETLKYTVGGLVKDDGKLDNAPDDRLGDLLLALKGRRLVAGWGEWRNVTDDDADDEAPDVLRGDDVAPELRGLPIKCPTCHRDAMWELPIELPRRSCTMSSDGHLLWRPPAPPPRLVN